VPGLWTDLLACLHLRVQDGAEFKGDSQRLNYHRVFGGQLLGRFIRAASATCPDKTVKSLHAVFAKEGRADDPVRYQVTRHHEGRSFRTDRWLPLRQHSPVLAHGRCFGRGDVLTEDGSLVASNAQEALLRFRDAGDPADA
jgi:acyl-CoA thioesterase